MTSPSAAATKIALDAIRAERARRVESRIDIVDWAQSRYYIKETRRPIRLTLHQKAILRAMFALTPEGLLRWTTGIYSTVKKSGKTTLAGLVARWYAEVRSRLGEVYLLGNDARQARERAFLSMLDSIRLTPGCVRDTGGWWLPGQWLCQKTKMECLASNTKVEALSVDASGEAGAAPDLTAWTELWGVTSEEGRRFWNEMAPVLTKRNSFRFAESYAGYEGESVLLEELYQLGKGGRQLTAHELAEMSCRDDVDGERYSDMLHAFAEAGGDPEAPVPVWVDEVARLFMYWDSTEYGNPRRMPWQIGPEADAYYAAEAKEFHPLEYRRRHENLWTGSSGEYIPLAVWDACREDLPRFDPGVKEVCVVACDAAVKQDAFAIVAVTRHPFRPQDPAIRACRKWDPPKGGSIDMSKPEAFLRCLLLGGCGLGHPLTVDRTKIDERFAEEGCPACSEKAYVPAYNIFELSYDPTQLADMMQRLKRELGANCREFSQGEERLIADAQLYQLAANRRLAHDGNEDLRQHVQNAAMELDKSGDRKMRITKKSAAKKVDLVVASSMACHRVLKLMLTPEG